MTEEAINSVQTAKQICTLLPEDPLYPVVDGLYEADVLGVYY